MPHQGGNQSSRKRGYSGSKHSATSPDNKALAGRDFFGTTQTGENPGDDDVNFGYPINGIDVPMVDQNNNDKWVKGDAGPGVTVSREVKGSSNDFPGGGPGT